MKKTHYLAAGILSIITLLQQNSMHAQILKKVIDNMKQNQQNTRANSPTQTDGIDTTGLTNNISVLGNLTGGDGISSSDSIAVLRMFKSAKGGNGVYYEQTTTMTSAKRGTTRSVSRMYFTQSGEGRTEMNLAAMMGAKNGETLTGLSRLSSPRCGVLLDDKDRKYSLNVIDTALFNADRSQYKVTKIGSELVNGYNCTHAKMTTTSGSGIFASSTTLDLWTSPAVPGYTDLRKMMASQNITVKMMQALDDAGCGGQIVKMESKGKDHSMTMELTRSEKRTFPASLFVIPGGYTQSENNLLLSNMIQAGQPK